MGLRTASVRRPLMAPALTDTAAQQELSSLGHHHAAAYDNLNTLALASELLKQQPPDSSPAVAAMDDKMGVQKSPVTGLGNVTSPAARNITDVDQFLSSMSDGDLGQNVDDLMQAIGDRLAHTDVFTCLEKELLGDVDMISMEETQTKDVIGELERNQAKLERKLDFLIRRVRKLQARHMGRHVSGEIAGVFENVHRSLKKLKENVANPPPEHLKPMSAGAAKSLIRKLETSTMLQSSTMSRQRHHSGKYFGSGSVEPVVYRSNMMGVTSVTPWSQEDKQELHKVVGLMHTELSLAQSEVDSEATVSSSGGESADEMQNYNNSFQQTLSIQKRAIWKYVTERAAIAARWAWLQAQIADIDYRIRLHTDLHKKIRSIKCPVELEGPSPPHSVPSSPSAVNGYRGQLPGASPLSGKSSDIPANGATVQNYIEHQCARTRPLAGSFRKRKLVQIGGLHAVSKKAARPSNIRCGCTYPWTPCAVCTGRTDPTHPRDLADSLSKGERIALLDPGFHPAISMPEDISAGIHMEAIMKTSEWQQRSTRTNIKSLKVLSKGFDKNYDKISSATIDQHRQKKLDQRRKYSKLLKSNTVMVNNKLKRGRRNSKHSTSSHKKRPHLTSKTFSDGLSTHSSTVDGVDEEVEALGGGHLGYESPSTSPLLSTQTISGSVHNNNNSKRNRINSYDIDNIVIPYSVAASTRVEKLQYKEILTPKWRIAADSECTTKSSTKSSEPSNPSQDSDVEDLTDESVVARHDKCEHDEKKKFLSYLKLPVGYGRSRSHKRTDSRAESSGANTPDPLSPHPVDNATSENSPLTSPPSTPMAPVTATTNDEQQQQQQQQPPSLPSVSSVLRRRTISQSRWLNKDREESVYSSAPEHMEVAPYEKRLFPLGGEEYEKMLKHMPENHQLTTNVRAQDNSPFNYLEEKIDSGDSESTESAIGDEDPNDPEWVDLERSREPRKR